MTETPDPKPKPAPGDPPGERPKDADPRTDEAPGGEAAYSADEEAEVAARLESLGYM